MKRTTILILAFLLFGTTIHLSAQTAKPNVIFIYADDLGYGDLSCYGATKINTPNLDKLAKNGIRFTNGHSTSATCTPSRFAVMTGQYPWRQKGTEILPGDAALIVPTNTTTLPKVFKKAGYQTAVVGKWHLGLGKQVEKNWNTEVTPGPNEVGFDYSFIFPATADRVPTVFMENHKILALDQTDPIRVDYKNPVGNDPTGKEHPELLKLKSSAGQGHNNTIVNSIGRIGYMEGGHKARWTDEEVSTTFLTKARDFIEKNKNQPFFLYFTLTEPHVPRMPATMFKGKSELGLRGDAILQLDWTVGQIMKQLEYLKLDKNTLIIFSSDNGPVLDDGYEDEAVKKSVGHQPSGIFRGGKYSSFEAGTRVPWIMSWPGTILPKVSEAMVCQMDLLASFSYLLNVPLPADETTDSENVLPALLGKSTKGRTTLITQGGPLAIIKNNWKYIEPGKGIAYDKLTGIEMGVSASGQLYNLNTDPGETENVLYKYASKAKELATLLNAIKAK
ncbi:sulfatase family protein [Pedobacter heparinus]|uniref:Sulfatase n=1 Tax=Pedobacter heparinus (strain ATCC 13125 / DSM 2366 / CIP 104194 / JCM 7457 / NBRC 12017 / NCIMB 9290 / NRRL B-14731 / HIM 762-3) TaxID=485917 RepID=C6Y2N5_PEDHD|nr:arylsulfatase [Pedobacter heparinus]ACU05245.1 sulfatase [Pedobacter heparinus DSM 2366]